MRLWGWKLTEEQAKAKWCPMSRKIYHGYATLGGPFGYGYAASFNRGEKADLSCLGSGCMMWRKDKKYGDSYYCGLAGKEGAL